MLVRCDSLAIMILEAREAMMAVDDLFGDLPEHSKPQAKRRRWARLGCVNPDAIRSRCGRWISRAWSEKITRFG